MKKLFPLSILFLAGLFTNLSAQDVFAPAQTDSNYFVFQNLTALENDQLPVEIVLPRIQADSVEYHLPRIIPGTYDVHNYGRFISEFKALDQEGNALEVEQLDLNRWKITGAQKLFKITYLVDDTYDHPEETGIFEPAGTSHEDSIFLLNNFGYIGYLKGKQDLKYHLHIRKPKGFYGSTALQGEMGEEHDQFIIDDYFSLHDNPLMYCLPDTATRMVGNARVLVSLYDESKTLSAQRAMEEIDRVLAATADYMGGNLPVDKYAVLIYVVSPDEVAGSYGALEHQTSTVLYLPAIDAERFYRNVKDITSHEFFHIITPLGIHSEQIADFDFIDPEMSRHIWLYEGVTEYNSHLVQVRDSIYSAGEFLEVMQRKFRSADRYNEDIPLTQASRHTLSFFKDQYLNFYQKGALAAMALDMKLLSLSEGDYQLIDLLEELGQTYGPDTFFVDDELFDVIAGLAYPELREFFARHYAGAEPFPWEELFSTFGVQYVASDTVYQPSLGGDIAFGFNPATQRLVYSERSEFDEFGKDLGLQHGDELLAINDEEITLQNIRELIQNYLQNSEEGDKIKITVARPEEEGEYDEEKLKARVILSPNVIKHDLQLLDQLSPEQAKLRQAWIKH